MRPDDVNFSLSTSSEILSEKADLISMELLQSVLFAVNLPIRIDTQNLEALIYRGYESASTKAYTKIKRCSRNCGVSNWKSRNYVSGRDRDRTGDPLLWKQVLGRDRHK